MLQHAGDDKDARECQLDNATVMLFSVETVYRCIVSWCTGVTVCWCHGVPVCTKSQIWQLETDMIE